MHNNPLAKWFIRIWCIMMTVYTLLAIISGAVMLSADRIVYMEESGENVHVYDVNLAGRKTHSYQYNASSQGETVKMTALQKVRLKVSCAAALLPLWQKDYSGDSEGSAQAWSIRVYTGLGVRDIRGKGDKPISFRMVVPKIRAMGNFDDDENRQTIPDNLVIADI